MGEQPVIFEFENSIGRFVKLLLFSLIVGSLLGSFSILCLRVLFIAILGNEITLPPFVMFAFQGFLFLFSLGWVSINVMRGWFWHLTFSEDGISLSSISNHRTSILSHEINEIEWQDDQVVFKTKGQDFAISLVKLPTKERIIFRSRLDQWSFAKLSNNEKEALIELEGKWWKKKDDREKCIEIEAYMSFVDQTLTRSIVLTMVALFSILILSVSKSLFTILFMILMAGPILWVIWHHTSGQKIKIDSIGIHYQKYNRQMTLPWTNMEAVLIEYVVRKSIYRFPIRRFSIWLNERQMDIPVQSLGQNEFLELLVKLPYLLRKHKIPYEVKLPEWLRMKLALTRED